MEKEEAGKRNLFFSVGVLGLRPERKQAFVAFRVEARAVALMSSLQAVSSGTLLPIDPKPEQWFLRLLEGGLGCQADSNTELRNDS